MKTRFAIIAACVGTFTLMQIDLARSQAISASNFTCTISYNGADRDYYCFGHVYGLPKNTIAILKAMLSASGPPVTTVKLAHKSKRR